MKNLLIVLVVSIVCLAFAGPAAAHGPKVSGSVTIWSGAPYGPGVSGALHYGSRHYVPAVVPAYYPGMVFFPACGHWHPPGYGHAVAYGPPVVVGHYYDYRGPGKHHKYRKHHHRHRH